MYPFIEDVAFCSTEEERHRRAFRHIELMWERAETDDGDPDTSCCLRGTFGADVVINDCDSIREKSLIRNAKQGTKTCWQTRALSCLDTAICKIRRTA
jgi:hypothetical protein